MNKKLDQILEKIQQRPTEDVTPAEDVTPVSDSSFELQRDKIQAALKNELKRFNLKLQIVTLDGEYIIYQGSIMNVWARISRRRSAFYRIMLERQLIKLKLIEAGPEQLLHKA